MEERYSLSYGLEIDMTHPFTLHGRPIAGGREPLICTPLVGRDPAAVEAELAAILPKQPDLIEWRVDFFAGIGDTALVLDTARSLKDAAGATPILFTCRSSHEGGQRIALADPRVIELYEVVCAARCVDLVDYELSHAPDELARVRRASRTHGIALVASHHDFQSPPAGARIEAIFAAAEQCGADVGKVAVMPQSPEDVLTLLGATWRARQARSIPVIGLSMGPLGAVSRMIGGLFGSAVTFAEGQASSAPGQVPIDALREVLATMRRAEVG